MGRFLPLAIFVALLALLLAGLFLNPRLVPSPLIGKPVPTFELERLRIPERTIADTDLAGNVTLLNVWATWCVGCREEHPLLVQIAEKTGVPIYGLNYKDQRPLAVEWLQRLGDPYVASGYDVDGRVGLDLGVYGLPETFVLDRHGVVRYKHVGPVTLQAWERDILPEIRKLAGERG